MMRKFRLIVKAINVTAILGNGSEGQYVVQIHTQCCVNVVDEGLNILF